MLVQVGDEVAAVDPAPGEAQDYFALLAACPQGGYPNQGPVLEQVGDEVAAVDPAPGEAQDYFALLAACPRVLLPKLVLHWGCADDAAARVAALLGCDLVAEVLQATLAPVRPPPLRAAGAGPSPEHDLGSEEELEREKDAASEGGVPEGQAAEASSGDAAGGGCACAFCRWGADLAADELGPPDPGDAHSALTQPGAPRAGPAGSQAQADPVGSAGAGPAGPAGAAPGALPRAPSAGPVLPILGAVGAVGAAGAGAGAAGSSYTLQLAVLAELAKRAPVRAALAALVVLLQRRGGLAAGKAPVLPGVQDPNPERQVGGPPAAARARLGGADGPGPAGGPARRDPDAGSAAASREDAELLAFAASAATAAPPLQRWIQLQAATNPALGALREEAAGGAGNCATARHIMHEPVCLACLP